MRWIVVAVVVFACKQDEPPPPKPPPPPVEIRLFTEAEIAGYETALVKRLDENAQRSCARPLLHGEPTAGKATEAIIAFVEPKAELANCMHKIADAEVGGKFAELVETRAAHVLAIEKECGAELERAVVAIASHEDACSAYQPGQRVEPELMLPVLRAAHLLGLRARLRAEAGDPREGLWLIAIAVRANHDLSRGHTNLIVAMIASASQKILLEHAQAIIEKSKLTPAIAAELGRIYELLLTTAPSFAATLAGESEHMALYTGLVKVKPSNWVPPGGTTKSWQEMGKSHLQPDSKMSPRDEGAMMLASAKELGDAFAKACGEGMTYKQCHVGLAAMDVGPPATPLADLLDPSKLAGSFTEEVREKLRRDVQRKVLDAMAAVARPAFKDYAAKRARDHYRLAAAVYALELARVGCAKSSEIATTATTKVLGDPLVVTVERDAIRMEPPAWTLEGGAQGWSWTFPCR